MFAQFQTEFQHHGLPDLTQEYHQSKSADMIGRPIVFATGQFTGRAIRAELREIQQADLGRKYVLTTSN
jgi:hypothetical protein